jgi:NAD(P)H-hydrate epimerase
MSSLAFSREQSRRVDQLAQQEFGFSGLVLMENAGRGVADALCRLGIGGTVVICCGKGNNAGDGFVIARHLDLRGHKVRVLLWAKPEELTGDAATNYRILRKTDVPIEVFGAGGANREKGTGPIYQNGPEGASHELDLPPVPFPFQQRLANLLEGAAWIVDSLLGTGAHGEPRPPLDAVIDQLNAAAAPKLAVDLPSGLDCDTGQPARHTIRATETCTFVAAKVGFLAPAAASFVGRLHVLDIGIPPKLIDRIAAEEIAGAQA